MNEQLPPPSVPTPTPRSTGRSRRMLVAGVGAGLLAGSVIGFTAGVPNLTSAATPAAVDQPTDETSDDTVKGDRLRDVLQPLVDDGTIDADQADAVSAHLVEHRAEHRAKHRAERGPGHRPRPILESIDTAVEVLGIDADTLRTELRDGSSLADIAEANGVDPQTLIDALVADAGERITDRVNGEFSRPDELDN